jgi:intracellular multiplication protein IcmL
MLGTEQTSHSMNAFYRDYSHLMIYILIIAILSLLFMVCAVFYQVTHRPLPVFAAESPDGKTMALTPYNEPDLVPGNLLKWASKAVVAAYTFDFVNYDKELGLARPYFTSSGWQAYQAAIAPVIQRVRKEQLTVNGIVSGAPVISNQGDLNGQYTWRLQIPFLATYQSADQTRPKNYFILLTVIKMPTSISPQGVGIDNFQMVGE